MDWMGWYRSYPIYCDAKNGEGRGEGGVSRTQKVHDLFVFLNHLNCVLHNEDDSCGSSIFYRAHPDIVPYADAIGLCTNDHPDATLVFPQSGWFFSTIMTLHDIVRTILVISILDKDYIKRI